MIVPPLAVQHQGWSLSEPSSPSSPYLGSPTTNTVYVGVVYGRGGTVWIRDASSTTVCHTTRKSPSGAVVVLKNPQDTAVVSSAVALYTSQLCLHYLTKGVCTRQGCAFSHRTESDIISDVAAVSSAMIASPHNASSNSEGSIGPMNIEFDCDTCVVCASATNAMSVTSWPCPHSLCKVCNNSAAFLAVCPVCFVPTDQVSAIMGPELTMAYGVALKALGFTCVESLASLLEQPTSLERVIFELQMTQSHASDFMRRCGHAVIVTPSIYRGMTDFLGPTLAGYLPNLCEMGFTNPLSLHVCGTPERVVAETAVQAGVGGKFGHAVLLARRVAMARAAQRSLLAGF